MVKSDPLEKKNIRTVLNLGHTLAHIIELKNKISHGESVTYGLKFSLDWSFHNGKLSEKKYKKLSRLLPSKSLNRLNLKEKDIIEYVTFDKKRDGEKINFVFITDKGPQVSKVSFKSLAQEFSRQVSDKV